jgi:hypothetical protein
MLAVANSNYSKTLNSRRKKQKNKLLKIKNKMKVKNLARPCDGNKSLSDFGKTATKTTKGAKKKRKITWRGGRKIRLVRSILGLGLSLDKDPSGLFMLLKN